MQNHDDWYMISNRATIFEMFYTFRESEFVQVFQLNVSCSTRIRTKIHAFKTDTVCQLQKSSVWHSAETFNSLEFFDLYRPPGVVW